MVAIDTGCLTNQTASRLLVAMHEDVLYDFLVRYVGEKQAQETWEAVMVAAYLNAESLARGDTLASLLHMAIQAASHGQHIDPPGWLRVLPAQDRACYLLVARCGLTYAQVATMLQLARSRVVSTVAGIRARYAEAISLAAMRVVLE